MEKETECASNKIIYPNTERTLLAICLKNPEKIIEVKDKEISGEMFQIEANKYIYYAIEYLLSKNQSPTPIAIIEVLKDKHAKTVVEEFGGTEYLEILCEQRVNEDNIEIFCEKLKQAYTRTQLLEMCERSTKTLLSDKMEVMNPTEIIDVIQSQVEKVSNKVQQTKEVYKMGDSAEEILELRASHPNTIPGLEVGWTKFDYYTNGGQPGDLIMLCARAKTGKSTALTNWATKIAIKDKIPVLYFDTEMNAREQEDRILSILSGVPHKEIISGMYVCDTENGKANEKIAALKDATTQMREGNYFHIHMPSFTMDKVAAVAKKFKLQYNIQAIFFDYLKFPASQVASLKSVQEWQMLGYIASGLKDLAATLKIPIWSACQENRANITSEKKNETNVGGSDRILQLASKLIFLSNKTDEEIAKEGIINGNQRLYIAYQRNGESDCPPINIKFDRPRSTQCEI